MQKSDGPGRAEQGPAFPCPQQQFVCHRQQGGPIGIQPQMRMLTVKQLDTQLFFQLLQRLADCCPCQRQPFGRLSEVAVPGYGHEDIQLPQGQPVHMVFLYVV